jgi:putative nucleotidyltransferase with HDIG domain
MQRRFKAYIAAVTTVGVVLGAATLLTSPLWPSLGGPSGLIFWIAVVLLGASSSVRMPGGTIVDVSTAPLLACAFLGGPAAAAVAAAIGLFELRELRGLAPWGRSGVPWYGSAYNHAAVLIPAVLATVVYGLIAGFVFRPDAITLFAVLIAGGLHFVVNNVLTAGAFAAKESRPVLAVLSSNVRQFGLSLAGLVPLAWLMASMYVVAGPIGVLPFAVPLIATRSGYKKVVEIRDMFTQTVKSLASAVDAKDPYTAGHSVRVQLIAKDLGGELRCSESELEALEWGGLLHDIGKIGIPDAILLKQGALTKEERVIMNAHPVKGEEILRPVAKLAPELPIIRHHHEWFNGSGYPDRLVGHDIPRLARIMHVADSFEAMTAARPYRMTPLSEEQAISELHKFSGVQFDPDIVAAFERVIARRPEWAEPNIPKHLTERHIPRLGETVTPIPA